MIVKLEFIDEEKGKKYTYNAEITSEPGEGEEPEEVTLDDALELLMNDLDEAWGGSKKIFKEEKI